MSEKMSSVYPNLSIIISTYERESYVNQLLKSIQSQTCIPNEIIIVDSSISSFNYQFSNSLDVKVVKSKIAQLTYQRNLGISKSNCDIILHIDDDVILERDYVKNIIETFNKDVNNEIDVVGGYILNEWHKPNFKFSLILRLFNLFKLYNADLLPGRISNSGIFIELQGLDKDIGLYKTDFISGRLLQLGQMYTKNISTLKTLINMVVRIKFSVE